MKRTNQPNTVLYFGRTAFSVAVLSMLLFSCGAPPPPVSPEAPPPEQAPTPQPTSAQKAAPVPGSIEAYAASSKWVVVGKVEKRESKWVGGKIVTAARLQPISVLKGDGVPSPVSLMFLGGAVGSIRQDFTDEIIAVEGETAVFFLVDPPAGSGASLSELPRIAHKVTLLKPGQADSRLKNNRRLVRYQNEITEKVKRGAN